MTFAAGSCFRVSAITTERATSAPRAVASSRSQRVARVEPTKSQKRSSRETATPRGYLRLGILSSVRSELVLRSPSDGTGWEESWELSGHDESLLRGYLAKLDQYSTPAPLERWEQATRVIDAADRWLAAMLLFPEDVRRANHRLAHPQFQAEAAWTAAGARQLAYLLPDELADLRASIEQRFGDSAASA